MKSGQNWESHIDPDVYKELRKIDRKDAERVLRVIELLPINPYFGDIQKLKDEDDCWRRRVGSYRLFYRVKAHEHVILVYHLERRTSKTY